MRRRDLSHAFFATAAGTALLARNATAQTCIAPCHIQTAAEMAVNVSPKNTQYVPGDMRRYKSATSIDDTAAMQDALKVSATHATLIPGGTAIVNATLSPPSGSRIVMIDNAVLKAASTLSGPVIYLNTVDDVRISGGKIDGSSAIAGTFGIDISQSTNVTVRDVWVTGATTSGIEIAGTSGTHCSNVCIEGCRVDSNGARGIELLYVDDSRIENCQIKSNNLGTASGTCTRIALVGNQVENNVNDGLAMGDSCAFITMSGNTSAFNGAEGLNIDGCRNSTICGNTSYQNLIGISCWNRSPGNANAGHNVISGNTVRDCYVGILVADSQPNIAITGNVVRSCGSSYTGSKTGTGNYGICVVGVSDFNITGNTVASNTWDGIYIVSAIGGNISNNYVQLNGHYGINLDPGQGTGRVTLSGNFIKQNGDGVTYRVGLFNRANSNVYVLNNTFVEESNPGVQQVPIDGTSTYSVYDSNAAYSLAAQTNNIAAGRQSNNSWNYQGAIPSAGTWQQGDIVWNGVPSAGAAPGWVCIFGGTSGMWRAMANIAP